MDDEEPAPGSATEAASEPVSGEAGAEGRADGKGRTNANPADDPHLVTLSLISHTNAGKTTLARTLLRRDIGEVGDQAHVTEVSEAYEMVRTDSEPAEVLQLWDTPGFGNAVKLRKRLMQQDNPIGWFLGQIWDRYRDRPLWCSQQAVRNVRQDADLVLYLINATEHPDEAGYVRVEMEILSWIGKPVVILLNQTGGKPIPREEVDGWRDALSDFALVRDIISLDAFSRCWVQEDTLLAQATRHLPENKKPAMSRLRAEWTRHNLAIFEESMRHLAEELAIAATDTEDYEAKLFRQNSNAKEAAMTTLAERLSERANETLNELLNLHTIEGQSARKLLKEIVTTNYDAKEPMNPGKAAVLGGAVTGALSGLAADFFAGGLTLGGGAIAGAIAGALGGGTIARGFNIIRGEKGPEVRWSVEFLQSIFQAGILRYLAVAHYGRGRGRWQDPEAAAEKGARDEAETPFYARALDRILQDQQDAISKLFSSRDSAPFPKFRQRIQKALEKYTKNTLTSLYGEFPVAPKK